MLCTIIQFVVCLMRGPWPLPKRVLHSARSNACSLNLQYPLFYLRPSSSCLRLLPHHPIMWPIQLVFFLFFTLCRLFLSSSTLCITSSIFHTIGSADIFHASPSPHFTTFQVFPVYFPKCPSFSTLKSNK